MKRYHYQIVCLFALFLFLNGMAWAVESNEEKQLRTEAAGIDDTAGKGEGEKAVKHRIEKEFGASSAQVQGLREKKMGYGEISISLSLAQKMPGGITDENIQKVMTMRLGPPVMGWGQIAKQLGMKLGPAISQVKSVRHEAREAMKHQGRGDKERMEKAERQEDKGRDMKGRDSMGSDRGMSRGKGK